MPHIHDDEEPEDQAPVDNEKYYKILGVEKDASELEIKKAYKKKARELHPDRHPDEREKYEGLFQELQQANEVLGDPEKRQIYDQHGERGLRRRAGGGGGGGGVGGGSMEDMMAQIFGANRNVSGSATKSPPIKQILDVTLEDLYTGTMKKVKIQRYWDESGEAQRCATCNGQGVITVLQNIGIMTLQQRRGCNACNGMGYQLASKDVELDFHVPPGGRHGETITLQGQGHEYPNHTGGDVLITLRCQKHPIFVRKGADLGMDYTLNLREALCGYEIRIQHVSKKLLIVKSKQGEIVQPGALIRVQSWGMPQRFAVHVKGHLYINVSVKLPLHNTLSLEAIQQLRNILPEEEKSDSEKKNLPSRKPRSRSLSDSLENESHGLHEKKEDDKKGESTHETEQYDTVIPNTEKVQDQGKSNTEKEKEKEKEQQQEGENQTVEEIITEEVIGEEIIGNPPATPAATSSAYEEDENEPSGCRHM